MFEVFYLKDLKKNYVGICLSFYNNVEFESNNFVCQGQTLQINVVNSFLIK